MDKMTEQAISKVPQVTLLFWIIKIAATKLGETGGDAVSMSMGYGYLIWVSNLCHYLSDCRRGTNHSKRLSSVGHRSLKPPSFGRHSF